MRYFFNIPTKSNSCNLNCGYCILKESDPNKDTTRQFSLDQLKTFIKSHSTIEDDVLIGFGGSEPFTTSNINDTLEMLDFCLENDYSISLLSNGMFNYEILEKYKSLLSKDLVNKPFGNYGRNKVGDFIVTFHRHILGNREDYYEKLAKWCYDNNINLIFQELNFPCNIDDTNRFLESLQEKYNTTTKVVKLRAWGNHSFKQSFIDELYKNNDDVSNNIDYKNAFAKHCSCFKGYDTYHILNTGDVIKCWYNQTCVGNIQENILYKDKAIKKVFNFTLDEGLKKELVLESDVDKEEFIENELKDINLSETILNKN